MYAIELMATEETIQGKAHYFISAVVRGVIVRLTPSCPTAEMALIGLGTLLLQGYEEKLQALTDRVVSLERSPIVESPKKTPKNEVRGVSGDRGGI